MNTIRPIGQAITSVNYTTNRIFNFNPEPVRDMAENFLASGIDEVEIPEGLLDPNKAFPETFLDEATLTRTIALLPPETKVVSSYFGPGSLGKDNGRFVADGQRKLDHLMRFFPHFTRTMLHPPHIKDLTASDIRGIVDAWAELARYAAEQRPGFQCALHNHYDGSCETADQVRAYLDALGAANEPALRWGPDTAHCHGMGDDYLKVLDEYAGLIGNHFHIKARIAAFDRMHGGERYAPDRDIWRNDAEFGRGLYGGFVNAADPEIETPFKEVFAIIREKARPTEPAITAAIEIDYPRQHPRLEILCSVLYLRTVHGIEPALNLSNDDILRRVFA